MTFDDVLQDIYALEDETRTYERKYSSLRDYETLACTLPRQFHSISRSTHWTSGTTASLRRSWVS